MGRSRQQQVLKQAAAEAGLTVEEVHAIIADAKDGVLKHKNKAKAKKAKDVKE